MSGKPTREQIIETADRLFYQQGFEHTSFAHIADAVRISRGNFYYHFKSKDEILSAVIRHRLANTGKMLESWQAQADTPRDRIRCFIHILLVNGDKIRNYGCPVGTLSSELAKLNHSAQGEANELFTLFHDWLKSQFVQLGRRRDAGQLAAHLLGRSQGVATLFNAFGDEKFVRREVGQMCEWLDDIANQ